MADTLGQFMHSDTVKPTVKGAVGTQLKRTDADLPLTSVDIPDSLNLRVNVSDQGVSVTIPSPLSRTKEMYSDIVSNARDFVEIAAKTTVNNIATQIDPVTIAERVGFLKKKQNIYKPPDATFAQSNLIIGHVDSAANRTASQVMPAALDKRNFNQSSDLPLGASSIERDVEYQRSVRGAQTLQLIEGNSALRDVDDPLVVEHHAPRSYHGNQNKDQNDLDGFFRAKANDPKSLPSDDAVYMPLVFTDMRQMAAQQYRTIYFKPYISSLSQDFAPDWSLQNYFGRVDPVAGYQSTGRTISISFKIAAETPEELVINYRKMVWLESMNYPQYDTGGHFKAGPVARMRVGDIFNAIGREGLRGLPGFISSLSLDYTNATWELINNRRLPKEIEISLSFQVLHEFPIGLVSMDSSDQYAESFGGINFNPDGKWQDVSVNRFHKAFGDNDWVNKDTQRRT